MKASAFATSIDELYERLKALTATKGEEYKRREDNQFANFERGAQALGLTREQVLMVYLSKHLDSITTYVKDRAANQEKTYAEPITGRIDDAILFLLLLRGMAVQNEVAGFLDTLPRREPMLNCRCVIEPIEIINATGATTPEQAERLARQVTMTVGGVTTPRREVQVDVQIPGTTVNSEGVIDPPGVRLNSDRAWTKPERIFVISSHQPDAIAMAALMGLPSATSALSATDQLHGVLPGAHVIFIHHGSRIDEAMYAEVIARCDKQGLTHERVDK